MVARRKAPSTRAIPRPTRHACLAIGRLRPGDNTTIAVVACNADLSTVECKRIAMMAQDGIARAVRPAHTPFDGDTVFALASSELKLEQNVLRAAQIGRIGSAAADCLTRAIARAVHFSNRRQAPSNRDPMSARTAAIGFSAHSGWAAMVVLGGTTAAPNLLDRSRVTLIDDRDPEAKQPYHAVEFLCVEEATGRLDGYLSVATRMARDVHSTPSPRN